MIICIITWDILRRKLRSYRERFR